MGAKYSSDGEEKDLLEIFDEAGYTMIRLRLFLDADGRWGAVNDLPYTLAMAKRVKAAGFDLMLDFHYSDTWADPAHQTMPGAWRDLGFEQFVQ